MQQQLLKSSFLLIPKLALLNYGNFTGFPTVSLPIIHFGLVKSYSMPESIESASLYPTQGKFIAGGADMWVRLFDFYTGEEIECNKGHHGPVHCVRFSPGGESYASGSEDGTIRIWQTIDTGSADLEIGGEKVKPGVDDVVRKVEGFVLSDQSAI
ncbi:hypothetical protein O6H91_Y570000 [Diphasiastrum complanatum]|nr:hypothetical protein O6H91_Y570000 [Diphasiastrum complanatum]